MAPDLDTYSQCWPSTAVVASGLDSPVAADESADNEHSNLDGSSLNDTRNQQSGRENLQVPDTAEEVPFPCDGEAAQHPAGEE